MVKVTVVFKYTDNAIIFKTKETLSKVKYEILKAKSAGQNMVSVDCTEGTVCFDPREAVGFVFEKA